jgi:hypothetical protein
MLRRLQRDDGASTLEFGLVLPILMILVAMSFPIIKAGYEYIVLSRAVSHGIRYASRADVNVRYASDGVTLTRRPSSAEVDAYIRDVVGPGLAANVTSVTVKVNGTETNPSQALPGEPIQILATYQISYGALDDIANAVRGLFFGGGASLPDTSQVTVSARGREE